MDGERRDVLERDARDLAIAYLGIHADEAGGRVERELRDRFDSREDAGLEQHGYDADGVGSRHGRRLHLFHDDEPGVRMRACWWQDQVAVGGRIAARLA